LSSRTNRCGKEAIAFTVLLWSLSWNYLLLFRYFLFARDDKFYFGCTNYYRR
jgi:hypothetical protein